MTNKHYGKLFIHLAVLTSQLFTPLIRNTSIQLMSLVEDNFHDIFILKKNANNRYKIRLKFLNRCQIIKRKSDEFAY